MTKKTHHWEAGTVTDGEVTLETKGEEHFSQLLLGQTVKWSISLCKVESIQTKVETHAMKMSGTRCCTERERERKFLILHFS